MFSRDSNNNNNETKSSIRNSDASVIGTEMQINGNIKCQGSLVLKGTVKGNIECDEISVTGEGVLKGSVKLKILSYPVSLRVKFIQILFQLSLQQILKAGFIITSFKLNRELSWKLS